MSAEKFTLARLKIIVSVVGSIITAATLLNWGIDLPLWVTALGFLLTNIGVYFTPNIGYVDPTATPKRALLDENGEPVEA